MANEFKVKKGLIVYGSGSTVFDVQGSQGQLFSVTDDLVGDVFSVNDISGLPILTVNTDEIVTMGTFGTNALVVSGSSVGVGTNNVDDSAILDVSSTSKGFLIPRMTTAQKDAITSPTVGLMVYDTDTNTVETYDSFWGWMPVANRNEWMRKWGMEYWNDFGLNNGSNDMVLTTWATNGGGQGITTHPLPSTGDVFIGLQGLRTGVNTNGSGQLRTDINFGRYMLTGNGKFQFETRIYVRSLSTITDRFNILAGLNTYGSVSPTITTGCVFIYDEGGIGTGNLITPNWQIITAYNSVRSVYDTGILVNTLTFYNFRVDVNDDSTEIKYYINNTLVLTETTNVPPQNNSVLIPTVSIAKNSGNTDTGIAVDYIGMKKKFITPR